MCTYDNRVELLCVRVEVEFLHIRGRESEESESVEMERT